MKLLKVESITKRFGGIIALESCSLEIEEKAITGLIGPNGAGKTTLINIVTGIEKQDQGAIYFKDSRIDQMPAYKRTRLGMTRTFQVIKIFNRLTLMENLKSAILFKLRKEPSFDWRKHAEDLLDFVGLYGLKDQLAMNLSYGQQKLLEFATGLMPEPELVMLDEPVSGVNPVLINRIKEHIEVSNEKGRTFVIVEHNIPFVMDVCDNIVVLESGKKIAEGEPESIRKDPKVLDAYLGRGSHVGS